MSLYYKTPFQILSSFTSLPLSKDVYVVSDSQYQEMRRKEAAKEIEILTKRAAAYRSTADLIDADIQEIRKDVGLLPASDESNTKDN